MSCFELTYFNEQTKLNLYKLSLGPNEKLLNDINLGSKGFFLIAGNNTYI